MIWIQEKLKLQNIPFIPPQVCIEHPLNAKCQDGTGAATVNEKCIVFTQLMELEVQWERQTSTKETKLSFPNGEEINGML